MKGRLRLSVLPMLMVSTTAAWAECDLREVVGYTLAAIKTVAGRIDKQGRHDDYQGCDFDRILVFDDNTGVRCVGYNYEYAYRPTAYIWARGGSIKMCVDSNYISVAPLRGQ